MSDYFSTIPAWAQETGAIPFEIKADDISGRIPVVRLNRWEDFTPFLATQFFTRTNEEYIFRGQRRYDWGLTPSLGRCTPNGIVTEDLASKQLMLFKRAARGRLRDSNIVDDDDELWAIGQHYGLKTPLLDWTYSPYVALFFAFAQQDSKTEKENPYRAIYILNKTFIEDDNIVPDIRVLEPKKDDHGRLVNQAGLFTFSPQDATIENKLTEIITSDEFMIGDKHFNELDEGEEAAAIARYICKVYIKNDQQEYCIRHLRSMNVHHASLFPDLIGASQYCNLRLDESDATTSHDTSDSPAIPAEPPVELQTTPPEITTEDFIDNIRDLLAHHCAPMGRAKSELDAIASRLSNQIKVLKVVDWQKKESVHAKIKSYTRMILRRYGIPEEYRNPVIDQIVDVLIQEDRKKDR